MRTQEELNGVTLLGNQHTQYPTTYDPSLLETFPNKHPENEYFETDCDSFQSFFLKKYFVSFGMLFFVAI